MNEAIEIKRSALTPFERGLSTDHFEKPENVVRAELSMQREAKISQMVFEWRKYPLSLGEIDEN